MERGTVIATVLRAAYAGAVTAPIMGLRSHNFDQEFAASFDPANDRGIGIPRRLKVAEQP